MFVIRRIYEFGTPYEQMYNELSGENRSLFTRNGVLSMLERDILTKKAPQRWQDVSNKQLATLDVLVCFEERIYDIVLEDLQLRAPRDFKPIHCICLDIKDTPEHAKIGGALALSLCQKLDTRGGENPVTVLAQRIEEWQEEEGILLHYSLIYV